MSRVVVHIDRLVVTGPADARAVETAVREAVTRELARPGVSDALVASGGRTSVDAGRVPADGGPAALGAAIGRSLAGRGSP